VELAAFEAIIWVGVLATLVLLLNEIDRSH
jgi:hypothetical protein